MFVECFNFNGVCNKKISRYCALKSIKSFVIDVRKSDAKGQGNKKITVLLASSFCGKLCEVVGMAGFLAGWLVAEDLQCIWDIHCQTRL